MMYPNPNGLNVIVLFCLLVIRHLRFTLALSRRGLFQKKKCEAFNWNVISIDGHTMEEIVRTLDEAEKIKGKPTVILARTNMGKGVSIFENKPKYHGVAPTDDELDVALKELGAK